MNPADSSPSAENAVTVAPVTVAPVTVAIVTHGSADDVAPCLESLTRLVRPPAEVVLVDCASEDGTIETAHRWRKDHPQALPLEVVALEDNRGFAGGMNVAIARSSAPFVLSLNADARPAADFVERLLEAMEGHPGLRVGAVTGRLTRPASPGESETLDACGMRLTATWRHLDRGSGEPARDERGAERYPEPRRVFGATGAATLFRRAALLDVALLDVAPLDGALPGEPERVVFDPLFHSFREDAEVAFRLQERGWEVLYEPTARCVHRRFNLPERRRDMPARVNYHSLKNRYLLRCYHQTAGNFLKTFLPTLIRDTLALGWVLVAERSSLAAYRWLWRNRSRIRARRRSIQQRRTEPAATLDRWFFTDSLPLEP